jgi:hypothetical protein
MRNVRSMHPLGVGQTLKRCVSPPLRSIGERCSNITTANANVKSDDACLGAAPPKRTCVNKQIYLFTESTVTTPDHSTKLKEIGKAIYHHQGHVEPPSTKRLKGRPRTKRLRTGDITGPRFHKRSLAEAAGEQIREVTQVRAQHCLACKEVAHYVLEYSRLQ